jgi:hypothetical protein
VSFQLLELTENAMRKVVGSISQLADEWRMRMLKLVPMLSSLTIAEKKVCDPPLAVDEVTYPLRAYAAAISVVCPAARRIESTVQRPCSRSKTQSKRSQSTELPTD